MKPGLPELELAAREPGSEAAESVPRSEREPQPSKSGLAGLAQPIYPREAEIRHSNCYPPFRQSVLAPAAKPHRHLPTGLAPRLDLGVGSPAAEAAAGRYSAAAPQPSDRKLALRTDPKSQIQEVPLGLLILQIVGDLGLRG